jgi:3-methylfumaryl-CoA hydratase
VHGPLIATLLLDLLRRHAPQARLKSFDFKVVRPTFDRQPLRLNAQPSKDGKSIQLWAQDHEGWLTMQGTAELA